MSTSNAGSLISKPLPSHKPKTSLSVRASSNAVSTQCSTRTQWTCSATTASANHIHNTTVVDAALAKPVLFKKGSDNSIANNLPPYFSRNSAKSFTWWKRSSRKSKCSKLSNVVWRVFSGIIRGSSRVRRYKNYKKWWKQKIKNEYLIHWWCM